MTPFPSHSPFLQVADRFGLDRLKRLCELEMLGAISVDSAAHILYTADQHNAEVSKLSICFAFYACFAMTHGGVREGVTVCNLFFDFFVFSLTPLYSEPAREMHGVHFGAF